MKAQEMIGNQRNFKGPCLCQHGYRADDVLVDFRLKRDHNAASHTSRHTARFGVSQFKKIFDFIRQGK